MQSLSILLAGKSEVEDNDNEPDNILVKAKNSGLWLVTPEVFEMFLLVESYFRAHMAAKFVTKIDGSAMVSDLPTQTWENPIQSKLVFYRKTNILLLMDVIAISLIWQLQQSQMVTERRVVLMWKNIRSS